MPLDPDSAKSRRALLAAALGASVAAISSALGRPLPARAADGETVLVGTEYSASSMTKFDTGATGAPALGGSSDSNFGVQGESVTASGVYGESNSASGVEGHSESGSGVSGESVSQVGVFGTGVVGVEAWSDSRAGVVGLATVLPEDAAWPTKTGVYGYAPADSACRGVYGRAVAGRGVYGAATTGTGVWGFATSGTAGYFATALATTGYALRAVGRVRLDKCAGVATIASGTKSVVVTPGIDLVSISAVVATLQGSAGGTTTVHRCAVNTTANTFTIYLTANSTAAVKVAWHVFG